jgi:hypothetical protein
MTLRDIKVQHRLSKEPNSVRQELYRAAIDLDIYGDLRGGEAMLKLTSMTDSDLLFLVLEYAYELKDIYEFKTQ